MDHPLRSKEHNELRKRVVQFLRDGYSIQRQSNIIFVCGGRKPTDMRKLFQNRFSEILPDFEFFEPEFAMKNYFSLGDATPFDIAEFEELIGELSHSIVLFPEAPGSFAETGYFSAIPKLSKKIILAIDLSRQRSDSFISLGPAKRIHDNSIFQPNIQFDYDNPDFSIISNRIIERKPPHMNKRAFTVSKFSNITSFELFSLIHQLVTLLGIATIEDIEFFMRSLFSTHFSKTKTKKITSILVGSKRLKEIGDFGHLTADLSHRSFLEVRSGSSTRYDVLSIDLATIFLSVDADFQQVLEAC